VPPALRQVAVFSPIPLSDNPVAVVKDAHDLTEKQMAAFARCARGGFNTGPHEQDSSRPVTPGGLDEGSHAGLPTQQPRC